MRKIIFNEAARNSFIKARQLIYEQKDHDKQQKMRESFFHSFESLLCMLLNSDIKKENLDDYGYELKDYDLELSGDFVDGSFSFCYKFDGKRDFNGGMILHGLQQTYSVDLCADKKHYPYWAIHT